MIDLHGKTTGSENTRTTWHRERWKPVLLLSLILLHSQWAWGETNIKNGKSPQAPAAISFQDGRLSANCEQLPLGLVLEELAQQASLTIYIAKSDASQKISAVFDALPLEQGIKRLLNGKDYALITAPLSADGSRGYRVATIRVLSKGQSYETIEGRHPAVSPPARRSLTPEQQRQLEKLQHEVLEAPDAAKRITALEALADRPGGLAALANVVPAALRDGDSEVRETALSVMARMEGEMPVKSLIDMAHTDPEPNLRAHALTLLTVIDKDIALRHVKLALQDTAPHVSHVAMHLLQRSWPQETGQNNP